DTELAKKLVNAVDDAAAVLDKRRPDWYVRIEEDRFNIKLPCNCVLGQVFPEIDFWDNDLRHNVAFNLCEGDIDSDVMWKYLENLWLLEINARLKRALKKVA